MRKKTVITSLLFSIFGLIFIAVAVFYTVYTLPAFDNGIKTEATILRIDKTYDAEGETDHRVYVSYWVDGQRYEGYLNAYRMGMKEGQQIDIYYSAENPSQFVYGNFMYIFPVVFGLFGIATTACGIYIGAHFIKENKKYRRLKEHGTKVEATVTDVTVKSNIKILGKNPVVICCADESGRTYRQKILATPDMFFRKGDRIDVYTDGCFPDDYVIDIDRYCATCAPLTEEERFQHLNDDASH